MSFHELREALVFAFSGGVISEEEFLILYEEYESTNVNFPHWEYEPFSLDNFDSSEARPEFRVDKEDPSLKHSAKDEVSSAHKVKQILFKLNKLTCCLLPRRPR